MKLPMVVFLLTMFLNTADEILRVLNKPSPVLAIHNASGNKSVVLQAGSDV
jgi:hypothetical protein